MGRHVGASGAIALTQLLIAGGIVAGGVGVGVALDQAGVFGGGDETVEVALDSVRTFDCPDGGEVGELHGGDRVLATGRDDEGTWAEVRNPGDLSGRVWVAARYLVPDRDLAELDVHECAVGAATSTTSATLGPAAPAFPGATT